MWHVVRKFQTNENFQAFAVNIDLTTDLLTIRVAPELFIKKKTPWGESASELYRPSDRRLSAK
jgi:hypothetical protein